MKELEEALDRRKNIHWIDGRPKRRGDEEDEWLKTN